MKNFSGIALSSGTQTHAETRLCLFQNNKALNSLPRQPAELLAEGLSQRLVDLLARTCGTAEQLDLAIAREFGARDFDTRTGGGTVRNVMTAEQALAGGFLVLDGSVSPGLLQNGLAALMSGREFIAITHGQGLDARVSVIVNDSVNKTVPTALLLWQKGKGCGVLLENALPMLLASPQDRIVLGPLKYHATRAGSLGLYHEKQLQQNCALHAINAMTGLQWVSKAAFDEFLIDHRLAHFSAEGATEDDFYRNTPALENLAHVFDLDSGVEPNVLEQVMHTGLPGNVLRFRPEPGIADHPGIVSARLLDFAEHAELSAAGCVVFASGHYLAFRKVFDSATEKLAWFKIDSLSDDQLVMRPSEFLNIALDHGPCEIISWAYPPHSGSPGPNRPHDLGGTVCAVKI